MARSAVAELFGLADTFPRPGWVVLDAARDHRFTGELVFHTSPPVRVSFDRGEIYIAERLTDPSLAARLVDAGALSAVQLERGVVRIGDVEHLGRLFERVPNVDRHTVLVTAELMTEECVGWLATQQVPAVDWTPYRHHESGMHQWNRTPGWVDLSPGDPLPAPAAADEPVSSVPPAHAAGGFADRTGTFDGTFDGAFDGAFEGAFDELVQWDQPSWLDGAPFARREPSAASDGAGTGEPDARPSVEPETTAGPTAAPAPEDWVDRLDTDGLPDPGTELLSPPAALSPLPIEPLDRFEIVWPSGEVDEDFGSVASVAGAGHDPDRDRPGVTARVSRTPETAGPDPAADVSPAPDVAPDVLPARKPGRAVDQHGDVTDDVVLAVRRAVASIEVGSTEARRGSAGPGDAATDGSRGTIEPSIDPTLSPPMPSPSDDVAAPGRVAVRSGRNDWSRRTVSRSVFDEPSDASSDAAASTEPVALDAVGDLAEPAIDAAAAPVEHAAVEQRAGALRRLISAIRR